ncbi:MAG: cytochrome C [Betaproteobacteria bacterium SG8_40]|jgi:cytochrome c553|nr:MAG: cytochrome C [Betaproteobacteria bacterium SG8_40]
MKKLIALIALLAWVPHHALAQDAEAGRKKAEACAACHGIDGNSTVPQYPVLASQTARYIYLQLRDFKRGRREDPLMSPMAANLSKEDMLDLAAYYASQKFNGQNSRKTDGDIERGRAASDAALCTMCHLGGFSGQNEVPRLAGQHYEYTLKQLNDFKVKNRTNDAGNMTAVVRTISDEDLAAIAAYISILR